MSDWVRRQFEKMNLSGFHRGGVVEGSGLRDGEVPAILSQGSPFVAPIRPSLREPFRDCPGKGATVTVNTNVKDHYPTPAPSAAILAEVARTIPRAVARGGHGSFNGVSIVPVPAGTEIRKDGQVEVVTATQAVHDENVVYVTPEHYEKLKAESEGNSNARR